MLCVPFGRIVRVLPNDRLPRLPNHTNLVLCVFQMAVAAQIASGYKRPRADHSASGAAAAAVASAGPAVSAAASGFGPGSAAKPGAAAAGAGAAATAHSGAPAAKRAKADPETRLAASSRTTASDMVTISKGCSQRHILAIGELMRVLLEEAGESEVSQSQLVDRCRAACAEPKTPRQQQSFAALIAASRAAVDAKQALHGLDLTRPDPFGIRLVWSAQLQEFAEVRYVCASIFGSQD